MQKLLFISNVTNKITNFSYPSYIVCKNLGIEFHLASNLNNFNFEQNKYKDIIFHNIECERNPLSIKNIDALKKLDKIINENEIDYIHCNTPTGGLLGRICGKKNKVKKIIYTAHGFHFYKGAPLINNIVYKFVEKWLAHYTDVLITINEEDYQFAQGMRLHKNGKVYKVNGVGIDTLEYSNIDVNKNKYRKLLGLNSDDFVCIGVGRIEFNKNYELSIKAISQCNDNVHLLICGDGPEKNKLIQLAKQLHIENQIHFLGFRNDIPQLLKISDCYLSTSKREGLPRALMEAMACGLPCIVSNIRGNKDLIENGINGYLINDSNDCLNSLKKLIDDKSLCHTMAITNRNRIKKYDISCIAKKIENIYKINFTGR